MRNMCVSPQVDSQLRLGDPIRFADLICSKHGMDITINSINKESKHYANEDMVVGILFKDLYIHFKPHEMNNLFRFLRYIKFKHDVYET